jgi:hypothetical protein
MPCFKPHGAVVKAKDAMMNGCHFEMKEKKEPYGNSLVTIDRMSRKNRKNRKSRKASRKNRKNTRRANRK